MSQVAESIPAGISALGRLFQCVGRRPVHSRRLRLLLPNRAVRVGWVACILAGRERIFCLVAGDAVVDVEDYPESGAGLVIWCI